VSHWAYFSSLHPYRPEAEVGLRGGERQEQVGRIGMVEGRMETVSFGEQVDGPNSGADHPLSFAASLTGVSERLAEHFAEEERAAVPLIAPRPTGFAPRKRAYGVG
jgi:hypothetical protein